MMQDAIKVLEDMKSGRKVERMVFDGLSFILGMITGMIVVLVDESYIRYRLLRPKPCEHGVCNKTCDLCYGGNKRADV